MTISCVIQECFKSSASISVQMLPYMAASYVCSSLGFEIESYRQAWCLEKVVCVTWKALLAAHTSVLKWLNQINTLCYIWRDNVALSRGLWWTEASSKITHCKLLKIPAEGMERERGRNKILFWPFSCHLVMRVSKGLATCLSAPCVILLTWCERT